MAEDEITYRVAIADDNPVNRLTLEREVEVYCENVGVNVEIDTVEDGSGLVNAIEQANEGQVPYTLILTDNRMPTLTGIEAARKIREFDNSTPICLITADSLTVESKTEEKAIEAGINHVLPKPPEKERLYAILEQYLPKPSQ